MTIKEVAQYANVSVATVSRVLNGDPKVKKNTSDAVKRAIEETGYIANAVGRNLRKAQSDVILVILPNMKNSFYADIVLGIEERCRVLNYNVLVCNVYEMHELLLYYCSYIDKKLARGVILVSPVWKRDYEFMRGKPIVSCCESSEDMPVPQIDIDNARAGREATEYLISLGAKKIALIGGGTYSPSCMKRTLGYLQAMEAHGLAVDKELIFEECFTYRDGAAAANKLLSRKKPDAVFATSDEVAVAFMNTAIERGYRVPEDIRVAGFDNIQFSAFVRPSLTTVDQPRYQMGVCAAERLIALLDGKNVGDVTLPYKLVRRQSTEKGGGE